MLNTVAIIGRPNVGKSTLFNKLTKSRSAIVSNFSGLTKDRNYGLLSIGDSKTFLIDTGGIDSSKQESIDNKISELHDSEAMRLLRIERNKKLSECDWRVLADVLQSSKFKEWINYRQALRDLPSSATPKLDSSYDLDLTSVTWPTEPS